MGHGASWGTRMPRPVAFKSNNSREVAMSSKPTNSLERDQRLQDVVLAYLKLVDAGQKPDQQELLARHPDLAADLKAFFSGQHKIQEGLEPLRGILEPEHSKKFSKR